MGSRFSSLICNNSSEIVIDVIISWDGKRKATVENPENLKEKIIKNHIIID